ncbi:MAG: hypothetical protein JXR40_08190 [Pontiellaceae bacterium]|nr:hypothetical protein [Pontiellaceae bacterium]
MKEDNKNPFDRETIAEEMLREWQNILDETAEILAVPAGLITRLDGDQIEIFVSSKGENNPYPVAVSAQYPDSGWYCEKTLKSRDMNLIPNAFQDEQWKNNPAAVDLNMISYLGMPISRPDGGFFGTVCFIDNKQNTHNEMHIKLITQVKRMVELSLNVILARQEIDFRDRILDDLSRIYPICSYCKKVREESGQWIPIEKYVHDLSGATASHGVCPECYDREMRKLS